MLCLNPLDPSTQDFPSDIRDVPGDIYMCMFLFGMYTCVRGEERIYLGLYGTVSCMEGHFTLLCAPTPCPETPCCTLVILLVLPYHVSLGEGGS